MPAPYLLSAVQKQAQKVKVAQRVRLFATPWAVQSMEFSRPDPGGAAAPLPSRHRGGPQSPVPSGSALTQSCAAGPAQTHSLPMPDSSTQNGGDSASTADGTEDKNTQPTRLEQRRAQSRCCINAAQGSAHVLCRCWFLVVAVLVACRILITRPGIEPLPPAVEAGVLTTGPPVKSLIAS